MQFFTKIQRDFQSIPFSVKWVVLMFSLWIFGWGFVDPLFSLYLKSIIPNYAILGILVSIPNLMAMLFSIPVGELEDHFDSNLIFKYGLLGYVFLGFAYLFAGVFKIIPLLLFTLILHWCISAMVMVSAWTYIKKKASAQNASMFVSLLDMFFFGSYGLAMFLGFYAQRFFNLNTVFLFISFTSFLAYLWLCKFFPATRQTIEKEKLWHKIMKFEEKSHPFRKAFVDLKANWSYLFYALILIFFVGLAETMILVFIPLFADEIGFNLGQVCLLMGIMYLPYLFSFLFEEIANRYEKINVSLFALLFSALTLLTMYFATDDLFTAILSTLIAVALALLNPTAEGMITALVPVQKRGEMTGLSSFFNRGGKFVWPFVLGFFAEAQGIHFVFLIVSMLAIILAIFSIVLKYKLQKEVWIKVSF